MTTPPPEPIMDVAHLGHVELLTPKPEESLRFFVDVMGMTESGRQGDSRLSARLGRLRAPHAEAHRVATSPAWATSPSARRARRRWSAASRLIEAVRPRRRAGPTATSATGPAYAFRDPDGHNMRDLLRDRVVQGAAGARKPALKNQAQRYPARGVNVRRLDHFNLLASDVAATREFFEDDLGMRTTEKIVLDNGMEAGQWLTTTNKTYDIAFTRDHTAPRAASTTSPTRSTAARTILRAADIFLENGVPSRPGRTSTRSSRLLPLRL